MNKIIIVASLVALAFPILAMSSVNTEYAKDGHELCHFIETKHGGFNEFSMYCAMSVQYFSPRESAFCHKLILENKIDTGACLDAISDDVSDVKLQACENFSTKKEILNCLKN